MNKTRQKILSMLLIIFLSIGMHSNAEALSISALSRTYYVSTTGNDGNAGTATAPFRTLSKGVSVLAAGDTLIVSGTYYQPLVILKSGTAAARINVVGRAAVIKLNGVAENGMKILGSFINITGFEVRGSKLHGVLIGGKNVKFENSSVHNNVLANGAGPCLGTGSWGSAIKVMVGAANVIVRGNKVYENCGEGIGITRGVNVLVENNTVRDNFAVNIYLDNSPYATAQNNIISCTGIFLRDGKRPTGIVLGEEDYAGWGYRRHHNNVKNNTITGCYDGIASWDSEIPGGKLVDSVISGNNIIRGTHRSMSFTSYNKNSLVENNKIFNGMYVRYPAGLILRNNVITSTGTDIPEEADTVPTASQAETGPSTPETIFDDNHPALVYSLDWQNVLEPEAYAGSYKTTAEIGASISLDFTGQSFSILQHIGPLQGSMAVYVDGTLVDTIARSSADVKFQERWDYPSPLAYGPHNIRLVFTEGDGAFDGMIIR